MSGVYEDTRFIMKKYGITANKKLGQNFLIDDKVIDTIVEASEITKEDIVIEIGPGLGTLTQKLLEKAGKVVAIELDDRMIRILKERFFLEKHFEILNDDVLKVNCKKESGNRIKKCEDCSQSSILHYHPNYYEIIRRKARN